MKKHATALRAFTHADEIIPAKQVILNMDPGQFADWSAPGVGLVREATDAEVAAARGKAAPATEKPARTKARKAAPKRKAAPVPALATEQAPDPVPPAGQETPADAG